jgi:hypothetical protein
MVGMKLACARVAPLHSARLARRNWQLKASPSPRKRVFGPNKPRDSTLLAAASNTLLVQKMFLRNLAMFRSNGGFLSRLQQSAIAWTRRDPHDAKAIHPEPSPSHVRNSWKTRERAESVHTTTGRADGVGAWHRKWRKEKRSTYLPVVLGDWPCHGREGDITVYVVQIFGRDGGHGGGSVSCNGPIA